MFNLTPYDRKGNFIFNPFRDFDALERAFFGDDGFTAFKADIKDEGDHYTLEADLPGFAKDDIGIDIENGTLTITAERKTSDDKKDDNGNYVRCERYYGSYKRRFNLDGINEDNISAQLKDGVLKLTMPKLAETAPKSRRLEIH